MRSNDRSIVQSVEVHADAALQNPNEVECVAGENVGGFIFDSNSTQRDRDVESASGRNERNANAQSSEAEGEHFEPHIVNVEELNEVRETVTKNHALPDEILPTSGCSRSTESRSQTALDLNS